MKELLRVGIAVADDQEYAPILAQAKALGAVRADYYGRPGHRFSLRRGGRTIEVWSLLCGIGKVNAAVAATALAEGGCDCLLSIGLSGGISGVARGEYAAGDCFLEHDFDLTCLGRAPCEKPGQVYRYGADPDWLALLRRTIPALKVGTMVSGDCFVSDPVRRAFLAETFHALSCDMETAAVAYVAFLTGRPFAALRRISDDAGASAADSYRAMNDLAEADLLTLLLRVLDAAFADEAVWKEPAPVRQKQAE